MGCAMRAVGTTPTRKNKVKYIFPTIKVNGFATIPQPGSYRKVETLYIGLWSNPGKAYVST
jgi:hypothetical protein